MLSLKNCQVNEAGAVCALYQASVAGGKDVGPIAVGAVRLESDAAGARCSVDLEPVAAGAEEDAFDALAATLESLAKAIRSRGEAARGVPVYGA